MKSEKKVSVVIPAKNEGGTINDILKILIRSNLVEEVVLVVDDNDDKTGIIAKKFSKVKVVLNIRSKGKGGAMLTGVEYSISNIILFLDADLIGLNSSHLKLLILPVLNGSCDMCVGVRSRYGGLPLKFIKLSSIFAIGGERCLKREVFDKLPESRIEGFMVESSLNYYCKINKKQVYYTELENIDILVKERKRGFWKGFFGRIKMIFQLVKIWITIFIKKEKVFDVKLDQNMPGKT